MAFEQLMAEATAKREKKEKKSHRHHHSDKPSVDGKEKAHPPPPGT